MTSIPSIVIKTLKFSLWVVQKFAPQIQYGGRPWCWKMDKLLYFSNGSTNFYEILHADAHWPSKPYEMFRKIHFKNPRWRMATILKNVKCDISAAVWPILMKFGMVMHLSPPKLIENQELKNFKIQDGGRRPSWKLINRNISEILWPIFTKFCMTPHISPPELTSWSKYQTFKNPRWRTAAILKIVECHISATVWPILVKFGTTMHIRLPNMKVYQKFPNFQIQGGGRRPCWK